MKDPNYEEEWVDALALRYQRKHEISPTMSAWLAREEDLSGLHSHRRLFNPNKLVYPGKPFDPNPMLKCSLTRASVPDLAAIRTMEYTSNILLFTPVIVPAGCEETYADNPTTDPFEPLGRALSNYHRRIRHVPYVAKVGFTDIHQAFVDQARAVITVVCEPGGCKDESDGRRKDESIQDQMDFAEQALDAVEGKETDDPHAIVLVQCGEDEYRPPVDASFMNVVETQSYSDEAAKQIAFAIFKGKAV